MKVIAAARPAIVGLTAILIPLQAQTLVNLRYQARNVDFSTSVSTIPARIGTTIPATCTVGELFFKTNAAPGQNVYGCFATNSWNLQGDGGGSGTGAQAASQLTDFAVTRSSGTTLVLGAECKASTPCNVRLGNTVYSITQSSTLTLNGGTGTAFIYVSNTGALTVGNNLTVSCSAGCNTQPGVTDFPANALPLYIWNATAGSWDTTGFDKRAFLGTKSVYPGVGVSVVETTNGPTVSVDRAAVGIRASVPATINAACTTGDWAIDATFYYVCISTNSWRRTVLSTW